MPPVKEKLSVLGGHHIQVVKPTSFQYYVRLEDIGISWRNNSVNVPHAIAPRPFWTGATEFVSPISLQFGRPPTTVPIPLVLLSYIGSHGFTNQRLFMCCITQ